MASDKSKKVQVLASRIKGKGEGEKVLADFWDYTCDLTVKTAFWKSKVASDTSEAEIQQQTISDSEESLKLELSDTSEDTKVERKGPGKRPASSNL